VRVAIAAGKDVYCEWPLGVSTAEARTLKDQAETKNVRTVVGLQARLVPAVKGARNLVKDGVLGRILS